ncbi:Gfo/Idh/MocA family protein [Leptospira stimsonii]|uniref:Oxidoreductase n=1 Tax=Leptospira stimsonii TaxID=2202203 RepID=A0A396Z9L9_9LEPT|nr:Gfo/Idh/MocA family oxidoreductase [Leptospira stimsonii]RHX90873.1 oxidoreductase [Leptospira stimsonii]
MSSNSKAIFCKVAFVGAGYMATEHIKAFRDISGVELCGIYSRTKSRADILAKEFGIPKVVDSVASLYKETNADIVVVSVPELSAKSVILECFQFPWLSLIEKPVGYNYGEANAIVKVAHELKREAYVALNRRHYSSTYNTLQELNRIDEPRFIHVQDQEDLIAAKNFGQPDLVLENWMYANSIHLIDYFSIFGRGRIIQIDPLFHWDKDNPTFVAAKILFDSGDLGIYQAVWNAPGPWAVSVTTHSKRFELRPLEQASIQLNGQRTLESIPIHEWDVQFKPGLRRQAEMVVKAFKNQEHSLPSLVDALESMRVVHEIYGVE